MRKSETVLQVMTKLESDRSIALHDGGTGLLISMVSTHDMLRIT